MFTRHLILGSNSFSGAFMAAGLLKLGHEVTGISRSPEPDDALLPYKWIDHGRFKFHALDLNHDLDMIERVIREFEPRYVYNFAAQSMVAQSWAHPEHWYQTNIVSAVKLHDRLRKMSFIQKYVQISTPEVYGSCSGLIPESHPFNPSTPYAVSKAAADLSLLTYLKAYKFPVVFTRAANVCGPGQPLYRIIPKTVLCILTGQKLKLEGGGQSVRSFIHMQDVVDGTLKVATDGTPGEAYHLATDRNQTIREVVEIICRQLGAKFEEVVEATPGRLGQDGAYLLDTSKARTQLGWSAKLNVDDVIRDTIEWLKKNLERAKSLPAEYVHKE
jgi:dTDP-glucose 4,6-dehydratase